GTSRSAGTPGAAAWDSCTEGMERASSRGARDDCSARPAPRAVSVSWVGLPKRSPRGGFDDSNRLNGSTGQKLALGMELLELAQVAPTLIHRRIVVVRLLVEVAPAHQAESFAIGSAERRERCRQDELLAKERREVDLHFLPCPLVPSGPRSPALGAVRVAPLRPRGSS